MKSIVLFLALMLAAPSAPAQTDPALREEGVLYLEGNVPDKVMATIKVPTTLYLRRDFNMALAVLGPGQKVEVVGASDDGYILKGTARNNTVVGWIHPQDLPTGFDPGIITLARKNQEHRDAVAVAITNKSVIQGMTPDEVQQSLGRPEQTASRTDPHGSALTWIYTTYREDPQYSYGFDQFGRSVMQTYYVKVPIGQIIIGFSNGVVASVEEHKTDPNSPGVVTN